MDLDGSILPTTSQNAAEDVADRAVDDAFSHSAEDVVRRLEVVVERGLTTEEVYRRRKRYGPNRLREAKTKSVWIILVDQFRSLIVLFLAAAMMVSLVTADFLEALAIGAVILINGLIGFFSELQAVRSMEALRKLGSVPATVRREGKVTSIPADGLVPGDVVLLEGGDVVTADLRLTEASKLQSNEAALTGESVPVDKHIDRLDGETPLPERANMVYKGTAVTRGAGTGVVVATGMATELGTISALVDESFDTGQTPLEKRLDRLGSNLIWLTLLVTAIVGVTGILASRDIIVVLKTSIALAVAAIPEGLPIVATLALARGMWRMTKRNALVNRLASVETLGATDVICVDKTGTLTEGQMAVRAIVTTDGEVGVTGGAFSVEGEFERDGKRFDPAGDPVLTSILEVGVLCNDASWVPADGQKMVGDPVEVALLVAGGKAGIERESLLARTPEAREVAFDPDVKMMATFHATNGKFRVAVKGAPEAILAACTTIRTSREHQPFDEPKKGAWLERNRTLASGGLRILAVAESTVADVDSTPYEGLCFLGFVGLVDPPRSDVRNAITKCLDAGIRVVMLTGDQVPTARYVGREVGLFTGAKEVVREGRELELSESLDETEQQRILRATTFARVTPKQKLDLVELYQRHGHIVAMTGDGVNDAPALNQADIGIAMGKRGTQVAREAADMILRDDAFATIVEAVKEGRVIFGNIRTFIRYLISCNVSEILVILVASVASAPLPLLPLQILFLNLVTDVFPALALGLGEGDANVMQESPRDPKEPLLTRDHWLSILGYGTFIAISVLGALALGLEYLGLNEAEAVTVSFLTLAMAQLWHVFNMRTPGSGLLRNAIVTNPFVWGALVLCIGLLVAAVYMPGLNVVLSTRMPGTKGWALALGMSLAPLAGGQLFLSLHRGKAGRSHSYDADAE
ncbi:MAG TPA: cation-transporting P-type ATPase [Vicinamibacteria bacterium]|nr:cation-transporting P-type ATPase [Vicinamibacteria bacterium]